jgi:hypothetical protein
MVTGPLTLAAGVKLRVPSGLTVTVPLVGSTVAPVTVRVSPSGSVSLPSTAKVTGVSSSVLAVSGLATGGVLAPAMLIVSTALALPLAVLDGVGEAVLQRGARDQACDGRVGGVLDVAVLAVGLDRQGAEGR